MPVSACSELKLKILIFFNYFLQKLKIIAVNLHKQYCSTQIKNNLVLNFIMPVMLNNKKTFILYIFPDQAMMPPPVASVNYQQTTCMQKHILNLIYVHLK
jgi:hypothetical protein